MDAGWWIEQAGPQDVEAMLELWKATPGIGLGPGDEEASVKAFLAANLSTCLVAKSREGLVGTVLGGYDGRRGYLYHLAVHHGYRGRGCGTALVKGAVEKFSEMGVQRVHLLVFADNQPAIDFYRHLGWRLRQDIQVMSWDKKGCKTGC